MVILKIIGVIILVFIVLLILLLISNVTYRVKFDFEKNNIIFNLKIGLFFSIISIILKGSSKDSHLYVRILFFTRMLNMNSRKDKVCNRIIYKFSHIIQGIKKFYECKDFIVKIISIIKPKYVRVEGRYGFEDPCITGMLSGVFSVICPLFPKNSIRVSPDFFNEVLNLYVDVGGKCRIILLVITLFKAFSVKGIKK